MKLSTTILVILFCAIPVLVTAQNAVLSVQGILKKSDGSAVPDDTYTLTFSLYDVDFGGTAVWSETIQDVETTGGVYSTLLGAGGTPLTAPFNVPYYLGVKIGSSNQELLPRPRLSAAPTALALLGAQNIIPSSGAITVAGITSNGGVNINNELNITGRTVLGGGTLANAGPVNLGGGNYAGYGFLGDGSTGYGSNAFGKVNIWAGGVNVMEGSSSEVEFKRHVKITGSTSININGFNVIQNTSTTDEWGVWNLGNADIGLEVIGAIKTPNIALQSDARIKKDITTSNAAEDLSRLLRLRVTNYRHKDVAKKGHGWAKGFIAQEVKAVYPEAVITSTDVIPDIYRFAESISVQNQSLLLTMAEAHGLKAGDKISLITPDSEQVYTVAAVPDARQLAIAAWTEAAPEKVFVYGREIPDFHAVNYDRLFTLNVSATQELARRVEQLERENRAYQAENQELRQLLEGLRADVNALKTQR